MVRVLPSRIVPYIGRSVRPIRTNRYRVLLPDQFHDRPFNTIHQGFENSIAGQQVCWSILLPQFFLLGNIEDYRFRMDSFDLDISSYYGISLGYNKVVS